MIGKVGNDLLSKRTSQKQSCLESVHLPEQTASDTRFGALNTLMVFQ